MAKINPLGYITDWDPADEPVKNVDAWYQTEYMRVSTSTDGMSAPFSSSQIGWFLAQGWVVYNTTGIKHYRTGEGGILNQELDHVDWFITFQRTRMAPKAVLKDMVSEFTKAYNEGRRINDQRYDELVHLYAAMVNDTQDQLATFDFSEADYRPLIDQILDGIRDAAASYDQKADAILDGYGDGAIAEINERFDELISQAKSDLVSRGLYNSTIYFSVIAEYERQRAIALAEARDKNARTALDVIGKAVDVRASIAGAVLGVIERMVAIKNNLVTPLKLRNDAFLAMLSFMERRTDDYPSASDLAQIVTKVGYANGGYIMPPGIQQR